MSEARRELEPRWEYLGIQGLRAFAALSVVLGHSLNSIERGSGVPPLLLQHFQGAIGVDVFFVISGFVMTISSSRLLRKQHPSRIFLWRRLLRVAPLYWLVTATKLLLIAALPRLLASYRVSLWNGIASFLFVPSLNPKGLIRPVITLGWTLNFEMAFYLLFAFALTVRQKFLWILLPLLGAPRAPGSCANRSMARLEFPCRPDRL